MHCLTLSFLPLVSIGRMNTAIAETKGITINTVIPAMSLAGNNT